MALSSKTVGLATLSRPSILSDPIYVTGGGKQLRTRTPNDILFLEVNDSESDADDSGENNASVKSKRSQSSQSSQSSQRNQRTESSQSSSSRSSSSDSSSSASSASSTASSASSISDTVPVTTTTTSADASADASNLASDLPASPSTISRSLSEQLDALQSVDNLSGSVHPDLMTREHKETLLKIALARHAEESEEDYIFRLMQNHPLFQILSLFVTGLGDLVGIQLSQRWNLDMISVAFLRRTEYVNKEEEFIKRYADFLGPRINFALRSVFNNLSQLLFEHYAKRNVKAFRELVSVQWVYRSNSNSNGSSDYNLSPSTSPGTGAKKARDEAHARVRQHGNGGRSNVQSSDQSSDQFNPSGEKKEEKKERKEEKRDVTNDARVDNRKEVRFTGLGQNRDSASASASVSDQVSDKVSNKATKKPHIPSTKKTKKTKIDSDDVFDYGNLFLSEEEVRNKLERLRRIEEKKRRKNYPLDTRFDARFDDSDDTSITGTSISANALQLYKPSIHNQIPVMLEWGLLKNTYTRNLIISACVFYIERNQNSYRSVAKSYIKDVKLDAARTLRLLGEAVLRSKMDEKQTLTVAEKEREGSLEKEQWDQWQKDRERREWNEWQAEKFLLHIERKGKMLPEDMNMIQSKGLKRKRDSGVTGVVGVTDVTGGYQHSYTGADIDSYLHFDPELELNYNLLHKFKPTMKPGQYEDLSEGQPYAYLEDIHRQRSQHRYTPYEKLSYIVDRLSGDGENTNNQNNGNNNNSKNKSKQLRLSTTSPDNLGSGLSLSSLRKGIFVNSYQKQLQDRDDDFLRAITGEGS